MPAKKTFGSIRVRGPAHFDQLPSSGGRAIAVQPLFKEYVALLSASNDPMQLSVVVLENTLGNLVWTVEADPPGSIRATLIGAFPDETRVWLSPLNGTVLSGDVASLQFIVNDADTLALRLNGPSGSVISNLPIHIRVLS